MHVLGTNLKELFVVYAVLHSECIEYRSLCKVWPSLCVLSFTECELLTEIHNEQHLFW